MRLSYTSLSLIFLLVIRVHGAVDLNSNGVCDIWEQKYNATSLVIDTASKAADEDGDSQSNFDESIAGTDPRDSNSVHRISSNTLDGTDVTIECPTEKGKTYQASISSELQPGIWVDHALPVLATGASMTIVIPGQSADKKFYRVLVNDIDSDGDGISDWAEEQMEGFDPTNDDSFTSGTTNNDIAALQSLINALNAGEVTIATTTPEAFEKEGAHAELTISRSGDTTYPFTLFLALSGHTDPTKGSASPADYALKDAANTLLTSSITIPAGASSAQIFCHPLTDTLIEVPETLTCTIGGTSNNASVRVCDATNTLENTRLFVAQLSPEDGVITSASGLSTVLVQGDNEIGSVNLTFYGLTTPQTAVHIHIKNPITGPHVESLPMGQVTEYPWSIVAAQFLVTDQAVLDALAAGALYVNVHSSDNSTGEIRGDYLLSTGSTVLVIPPNPPAIETLTADELDRDIARFLTQATFGPTPELITELRTSVISAHNGDRIAAYTAWLDTQMATASPDLEPYIHAADAQQIFLSSIPSSPDYDSDYKVRDANRRRGWWLLARHAPDQFRQRCAFALSEILVTSEVEAIVKKHHYGHAHYYDMLKDGTFGSYRDLLEGVSTHPIMGQYLSHLRNSKEIIDLITGEVIVSPDENYAREVMQLFSIGLVQLHEDGSLKLNSSALPDPTYLQDDISAMSRVFTGWSFGKKSSPSNSDTVVDNNSFTHGFGSRYYQAQWSNRMINFAAFHDDLEKVMPTLGLNIGAGGGGEADLDATMNHLADHPNMAPFICRRLIQRLVTSNPSAGYIYRITQIWKSSNGDLGLIFKAILLDYEARSLNAAAPDTYGKKKEPLIHTLAYTRALDSKSLLPLEDLDPSDTSIADLASYAYSPSNLARFTADLAKFPVGTTRIRMPNTDITLSQTPLASPTVFNYFLPGYTLAGPLADAGLSVPELQLANEISVITIVNIHYGLVYFNFGMPGNSLPNKGDTNTTYNPYEYSATAAHIATDLTGASAAGLAYLTVMDTDGDGKVTSADSTFNDDDSINDACVALANHLDLLLCTGRMKAKYGSGYIPGTVRIDNPRDTIIDTMARQSAGLDGNDNDADQASVLKERIRVSAYLISTAPQAQIQK